MIKPALTEKEWDYELDPDPRRKAFAPEPLRTGHARAALNLYGKAFGFTRGDVENLRHVGQSRACGPHRGGALLNLADRIEALLPPEDV